MIDRKLPHQIADKVKFLRSSFKQLPELANRSTEALTLLERAEGIAKVRHFLVHGAISHAEEGDGSLIFIKLDGVDNRTIHKGE